MTTQLEHAPTTPEIERPPEPHPALWIGTASDYGGERRYGGWVRAAQPARELFADIRDIIDRTPDGLGQHWRVWELRDYGPWRPTEHDGLPTMVEVAHGIARFGLAYSGLVAAIGADHRGAAIERFPQTYLGSWPSIDAFADSLIRDSGWHEHLARLPDSMRDFVRIDTRKLIRAARRELTIVDHSEGVWVYDPRIW